MLCVTSSPVVPSPRVAPNTSSPRYRFPAYVRKDSSVARARRPDCHASGTPAGLTARTRAPAESAWTNQDSPREPRPSTRAPSAESHVKSLVALTLPFDTASATLMLRPDVDAVPTGFGEPTTRGIARVEQARRAKSVRTTLAGRGALNGRTRRRSRGEARAVAGGSLPILPPKRGARSSPRDRSHRSRHPHARPRCHHRRPVRSARPG